MEHSSEQAEQVWKGDFLGNRPIALALIEAASPSDHLRLIVTTTECRNLFEVQSGYLSAFIAMHEQSLIISRQVSDIFWKLHNQLVIANDTLNAQALWRLVDEARWIDVDHLESQISRARNNRQVRDKSTTAGADFEQLSLKEKLESSIKRFGVLREQAEQLTQESEPIPPPSREDTSTPTDNDRYRKEFEKHVISVYQSRKSGPDASVHRPDQKEQSECKEPDRPKQIKSHLIGHGHEIKAEILKADLQKQSLQIDTNACAGLLQKAEVLFKEACLELLKGEPKIESTTSSNADGLTNQPTSVRQCFHWNDELLELDRKGHIKDPKGNIQNWLRHKRGQLFDVQHQSPQLPTEEDGRITPYPEAWGHWIDCDRQLWAWRQAYRMTELARCFSGNPLIQPKYSSQPYFRALNPNLVAYRTIGIEALRPRSGYKFIVGMFLEMKIRCLSAVSLIRKYAFWRQARLHNFLLREEDPILTVAKNLYARLLVQDNEHSIDTNSIAQEQFDQWKESEDPNLDTWMAIALLLLETAYLNLPDELLLILLKNQGLELTLPTLEDYRYQFRELAHEVKLFDEDNTWEIVSSRLGLDIRKALELVDPEYVEQTSKTLINALKSPRTHHPMLGKLKKVIVDNHQQKELGIHLVTVRGASLVGRVTQEATSSLVKTAEVQLSFDEVIVAALFALRQHGYQLIAVADSEFVIEVLASQTSNSDFVKINAIIQSALRGLLGDMGSRVSFSLRESW